MSEPIVVPGVLAGERVDRAVALLTGWSRADVQVLLAKAAIVIDGRRGEQEPQAGRGHRHRAARRAGGRRAARPRRHRRDRRALRRRRRDRRGQARRARRASRCRSRRRHARERPARPLSRRRRDRRSVPTRHRAPARPRHERPARRRPIATRVRQPHRADLDPCTVDRRYVRARVGRALDRRAASSTRRSAVRPHAARAWRCASRARSRAPSTRCAPRYVDPECSLLDCRLETGRTHQIRVHLDRDRPPDRRRRDLRRVAGSRSGSTDRSCTRPDLAFDQPGDR